MGAWPGDTVDMSLHSSSFPVPALLPVNTGSAAVAALVCADLAVWQVAVTQGCLWVARAWGGG
jgi:hypothetical protein